MNLKRGLLPHKADDVIHEAVCVFDGRCLRIFDPDYPEAVPSISTHIFNGPTDRPLDHIYPHRRNAR